METFYAVLAICAGNSPVTGEFPIQRPVTQSYVFFDLRQNNTRGIKKLISYNDLLYIKNRMSIC